jgi:hypothetical protein
VALTKFNFNSFDVTTAASTGLGFNASANGFSTISATSMILIKTLTASSSSTLSFVHGSSDVVLDSTYPVYLFKFINIHPSNDGGVFEFNFSVDSGSNYNVAKTTTAFRTYHAESDAEYQLAYEAGGDLAQGTGFQMLNLGDLGGDNDQSFSGTMTLFNPSSTTFVKHFTSEANNSRSIDYTYHSFIAGYGNTTSAINAIQFKNSSNNIDAGTIKLYGIKDS